MQLLAPDAHPISATEQNAGGSGTAPAYVAPTPLTSRVSALEAEVSVLREAIRKLAQSLGEADPFPPA
jgi:hypothetical protein